MILNAMIKTDDAFTRIYAA